MKLSRKHSATLTLGFLIALATPPLFHAQTATQAPANSNRATANPVNPWLHQSESGLRELLRGKVEQALPMGARLGPEP